MIDRIEIMSHGYRREKRRICRLIRNFRPIIDPPGWPGIGAAGDKRAPVLTMRR
jgi:hypothetical protein